MALGAVFTDSAGFDVASQLQAIAVGDSSDDIVRNSSNLLEGYGLAVVRCPDIYSSIPRLREARGGVVVGRFQELCKEGGRFFEIARVRGFSCCCFVDECFAGNRRELVEAIERGVLIVTEAEEIEEVLAAFARRINAGEREGQNDARRGHMSSVVDKILGDAMPARSKPDAKSGFSNDEFRMTKAEFDALLGA
ncbi:MAG: hypothetical protein ACYS8Z_21735 [Planctomycetota bacterium]